jgi:hypothetical protein
MRRSLIRYRNTVLSHQQEMKKPKISHFQCKLTGPRATMRTRASSGGPAFWPAAGLLPGLSVPQNSMHKDLNHPVEDPAIA